MRSVSPDRILNTATSQADRVRGAPAPQTVAADGRDLAQTIAFAGQYGRLILFHNLEDEPDGTWAEFFAADPAVTAALHVALDLPEIERTLRRLLAAVRTSRDPRFRLSRIGRVLAMVSRLIAILEADGGDESGVDDDLHRLLDLASKRQAFADPAARLRRHTGRASLGEGFTHEASGRDPGWGGELVDIVEDLVATLIDELRRGAPGAEAALAAALAADDHAPQAAIYNAFAILLDESRTAINSFPRRLVDFYYDDVLKQHDVAAEPDSVFLTFTPANPGAQASVQRGALFPAGTDANGATINYAATEALEVTATTVTGLSVHRVISAPLDANGTQQAAAQVLSGEVAIDPGAPDPFDPFPMFGSPVVRRLGPLPMVPASLGFTIASPTLMLAGGSRTVTITLALTAGDQHQPPSNATASFADPDLLASIANLIETTFQLHYSTAGGWVAVTNMQVEPAVVADPVHSLAFAISFALPPDAPPLVETATKPKPGAPKPSLPTDAFPPVQDPTVIANLLTGIEKTDAGKQMLEAHSYAMMARLEVSTITIDVAVTGLTDLSVTTPNGPADTSQNFAAFGLPPAKGSAVSLHAPELFAKPLASLSVTIGWAGLPTSSTGFAGYYQDYLIDADGVTHTAPLIDNSSFQAAFSVVNPGWWTVPGATAQPLFRTTPAHNPPTKADLIAPPQPSAPLYPVAELRALVSENQTPPDYYDPTNSALRLTLVAPDYAFGNALYTANLMAASQAQAQRIRDKSDAPPVRLPNPPWLPMAGAIAVDYTATATFTGLGQAAANASASVTLAVIPKPPAVPVSFQHIAPFDRLKPASAPSAALTPLLPAIEPNPALYVELTNPTKQVTLLFVLGASESGWWSNVPPMQWEQYVKGQWRAVELLEDTTNGLRNSGIVALGLHAVPSNKKTTRLRVQALGPVDNAPLVKAVIPNALTAQWSGPGGAETRGVPLPAGTIKKSASTLSNIGTIAQPMQSIGGCPPESGHSFQRWMAERLRHKGYAIAGWDYARLALEHTPSLWQVAVVPATEAMHGRERGGAVWIVAVGGRTTPNVTDPTHPLVDPTTLSDIGDMLKARVNPFIADSIAVTNPPYLSVHVVAHVQFNAENTREYWEIALNDDLVKWLSPWPDAALGVRPDDYYTHRAVAEFIRHRRYVISLDYLALTDQVAAGDNVQTGWFYLTSAKSHLIKGRTADSGDIQPGSGAPLRMTGASP
jgi:hypothetical protein